MSYTIMTSNLVIGEDSAFKPKFKFRVYEQGGGLLRVENDGGSAKMEVDGDFISNTVEVNTVIPVSDNVTIQGSMRATGNVEVDDRVRLKGIDPLQDGNVIITGNIFSTDSYTSASDQRLKTNIITIGDAMGKIRRLAGVEFEWRDDIPNMPYRGKDLGVIAQQVANLGYEKATSLAPFDLDSNGKSKSGNNYLTVDQGNRLTALLIQAVKEMDERLQCIEKKMVDDCIECACKRTT